MLRTSITSRHITGQNEPVSLLQAAPAALDSDARVHGLITTVELSVCRFVEHVSRAPFVLGLGRSIMAARHLSMFDRAALILPARN